MDNVDEKIKEIVMQSFSEHEVGKGIMEAMAEGMHAQGSELMKMRKDLDLTNEQLPQLAVQKGEDELAREEDAAGGPRPRPGRGPLCQGRGAGRA